MHWHILAETFHYCFRCTQMFGSDSVVGRALNTGSGPAATMSECCCCRQYSCCGLSFACAYVAVIACVCISARHILLLELQEHWELFVGALPGDAGRAGGGCYLPAPGRQPWCPSRPPSTILSHSGQETEYTNASIAALPEGEAAHIWKHRMGCCAGLVGAASRGCCWGVNLMLELTVWLLGGEPDAGADSLAA